jgi:peptide chain release factor 3
MALVPVRVRCCASAVEIATDLDGDHVFLAPSAFALSWVAEKNPDIKFTDIKTVDAR